MGETEKGAQASLVASTQLSWLEESWGQIRGAPEGNAQGNLFTPPSWAAFSLWAELMYGSGLLSDVPGRRGAWSCPDLATVPIWCEAWFPVPGCQYGSWTPANQGAETGSSRIPANVWRCTDGVCIHVWPHVQNQGAGWKRIIEKRICSGFCDPSMLPDGSVLIQFGEGRMNLSRRNSFLGNYLPFRSPSLDLLGIQYTRICLYIYVRVWARAVAGKKNRYVNVRAFLG